MKGKIDLVTGSTSGIGWGMVGTLAEAGAGVMLHDLGDLAELERLRAGLARCTGLRVVVLWVTKTSSWFEIVHSPAWFWQVCHTMFDVILVVLRSIGYWGIMRVE